MRSAETVNGKAMVHQIVMQKVVAKKVRSLGKQKETATVVAAKEEDEEMFAFTCTSDYTDVAAATPIPKSSFGTCVDSGASNNYSPDRTKFSNYKEID